MSEKVAGMAEFSWPTDRVADGVVDVVAGGLPNVSSRSRGSRQQVGERSQETVVVAGGPPSTLTDGLSMIFAKLK